MKIVYNCRRHLLSDVLKECEKYDTYPEQIVYLKHVKETWPTDRPSPDPNGRLRPSFEEQIDREIKKREIIIGAPIQSNKKKWTEGKKEFVNMVREEHAANKKKYTSQRKATQHFYNMYKFNFEWTFEKCYDYVKKR